jgi:hypothetical protein
MKILTLLLAIAALSFASCAGAPKKTASCCASGGSTKACPANDPHCKAPQKKTNAS